MNRLVGYLAVVLGALGAVLSAAAVVGVLWFGFTVANFVESVMAPVHQGIDRIDQRISESVAAIETAEGPAALQAPVRRAEDAAVDAQQRVAAVGRHPLVAALPVDMDRLSAVFGELEETAVDTHEVLDGIGRGDGVPARVKTALTQRLGGAQDQLASAGERIRDAEARLRMWTRLASAAGFLVGVWSLWAQLALVHYGRRRLAGRA